MAYALHLAILSMLWAMLAASFVVGCGLTRVISLAHASFWGVGAYASALLTMHFGLPFWLAIPIAMTVAGLFALPLALVSLRVVEDYFVVCSVGFGAIVFALFNNLVDLTRGPLGIAGIPPITIGAVAIDAKVEWTVVLGAVLAAVWFVARNLQRSALGRLLVAIGEDEVFCQSLGKAVGRRKVQAFVLGAALAALPGALLAHYVSYIDPSGFALDESVAILTIAMLGGLRSVDGAIAAALLTVVVPELLRFVGLPTGAAANVRQILFGAALVAVVTVQAVREQPDPKQGQVEL